MSLIQNIYNHIDSQIMAHVNAGVRAWNWTTGRTKADLIASTMWLGPTGFLIDAFTKDYPGGLEASIFGYIGSALFSTIWKKQEKVELKAEEEGLKDPMTEIMKETNKIFAPLPLVGSYLLSNVDKDLSALGSTVISACFYISRADSLPPRKDCIRRGLDKLVEAYQRRNQEQALPTPA